ncbi:MAG: polymerase subunit delta [Nocardioidaceae bacterium]|jgi:DNA polymerase-3 subunit delta'|nr:polymerase subunit delta [Nocardioidaceae bacterium]
MTVWDSLVGQRQVVETLDAAARGRGMTHAWLITGPPGSGRSNAAVAFAAALQCENAGCGECRACRTTLAGSNLDVTVHVPERAQIQVDEARDWVLKAARRPIMDPWQIRIVEDADRLNDSSGNALLKAVEEPAPRTVWILCAPQPEDVLPTIRSRTRQLNLATPSVEDVADFLVRRFDVAPARAAHAARASQGHIGRAKALALDEETRNRRRQLVQLPPRLTSLGACMTAAANLVDIADAEAKASTDAAFAQEMENLETIYGTDRRTRAVRSARAAEKDLADQQKARLRRQVLDAVDRSLTELLSVYRDVLVLQTAAGGSLVNEEQRGEVEELARRTTAEGTLRRIDAVHEAREQMLEFNVPPLLALESMMTVLRTGTAV